MLQIPFISFKNEAIPGNQGIKIGIPKLYYRRIITIFNRSVEKISTDILKI
jgi:hypothetical protein